MNVTVTSAKDERLAKAALINGWMESVELEWLYDNAAGKELVIEFGSWCGRSATALLAAKKLVCVDHWRGSHEHKHIMEGLDVYAEFTKRFKGEITSGHLVVERGDLRDETFAAQLDGKYRSLADMVFVDASHLRADVRSDIVLADALVKPGGVVAGHDYRNPLHTDVTGVVDEFMALVGAKLSVVAGIWWCRR